MALKLIWLLNHVRFLPILAILFLLGLTINRNNHLFRRCCLTVKHPDMHDVLQLYQKQIGPISGAQREKLYQACDEGMSPFVIGCAILRTSQEQRQRNLKGQPKRISFNYLWGIIQDWLLHGITTESAFRAYWEGQQGKLKQNAKGGRTSAVQSSRQVFGKDYQYSQRTSAAEGFFSFLDD